jgi:hypothetical protein
MKYKLMAIMVMSSMIFTQDDRAIGREKFFKACADIGEVAKDCWNDSVDAVKESFIAGAQREADTKEGLSPQELQVVVEQSLDMMHQALQQAPTEFAKLANQAGLTSENIVKTAEQIALELQQAADFKRTVQEEELTQVGTTVEKVVDKVTQIAQESLSSATEVKNFENVTTSSSSDDQVGTKSLPDQAGHQKQDLVGNDNKDQSHQQVKASWLHAAQATMTESMITVSSFVYNHPYALAGTLVTVTAIGVYAYQKYYDQDAQFEQD